MENMSNELSQISGYWRHSYEEKDVEPDVLVFRPKDYNFPASRGRQGIEIKNGEVVFHQFGPDDRPIKTVGYFKSEGPNKIKVFFKDDKVKPLIIEILSLHNSILRIRIIK